MEPSWLTVFCVGLGCFVIGVLFVLCVTKWR